VIITASLFLFPADFEEGITHNYFEFFIPFFLTPHRYYNLLLELAIQAEFFFVYF